MLNYLLDAELYRSRSCSKRLTDATMLKLQKCSIGAFW